MKNVLGLGKYMQLKHSMRYKRKSCLTNKTSSKTIQLKKYTWYSVINRVSIENQTRLHRYILINYNQK
jgi:hypothetical protein